jgi:hypothetical protein
MAFLAVSVGFRVPREAGPVRYGVDALRGAGGGYVTTIERW